MSTLLVVAALLLSICYLGESSYIVYRAYWGANNIGASNCTGLPDNVGVLYSVPFGADTCSSISTTTVFNQCTSNDNGVYYSNICVTQMSEFTATDESIRPPFPGTWVEVRNTEHNCSLAYTVSIVGWFANGVCARSLVYPSFNSRVLFNSSSAELRLNCDRDRCETLCSRNGATVVAPGSTQACIGNYLLRPVGVFEPATSPRPSPRPSPILINAVGSMSSFVLYRMWCLVLAWMLT